MNRRNVEDENHSEDKSIDYASKMLAMNFWRSVGKRSKLVGTGRDARASKFIAWSACRRAAGARGS